ncbi:MAG: class I SAM-dependent methyltransferase [Verrucomicrobiota bacterium]|nr:class I SAM-dependent methyltransferase [Verrucomicrobiota bacterium]
MSQYQKTLRILLCISVCGFGALPEPYEGVVPLPFDPQGYYNLENAEQIERLFAQNKIEIAIEVGCWLGTSTRHIASLLPSGGKLFAVDHWLGSSEHQPGGVEYQPAIHYLYHQFLSNVIHAGLTDKIIPVKMNSLDAKDLLSMVDPDFIYIDASHETEAVLDDLRAWYPLIQGDGIFCGDDWGHPPVATAVKIFAEERHLMIEAHDNFWRLIKPH